MKITYELDNNTSVGDIASKAIWQAYKLGLENGNLNSVTYSGCENYKNFFVSLDIEELM